MWEASGQTTICQVFCDSEKNANHTPKAFSIVLSAVAIATRSTSRPCSLALVSARRRSLKSAVRPNETRNSASAQQHCRQEHLHTAQSGRVVQPPKEEMNNYMSQHIRNTNLENPEIRLQNDLCWRRGYRDVNHLQKEAQVGEESAHGAVSKETVLGRVDLLHKNHTRMSRSDTHQIAIGRQTIEAEGHICPR